MGWQSRFSKTFGLSLRVASPDGMCPCSEVVQPMMWLAHSARSCTAITLIACLAVRASVFPAFDLNALIF